MYICIASIHGKNLWLGLPRPSFAAWPEAGDDAQRSPSAIRHPGAGSSAFSGEAMPMAQTSDRS